MDLYWCGIFSSRGSRTNAFRLSVVLFLAILTATAQKLPKTAGKQIQGNAKFVYAFSRLTNPFLDDLADLFNSHRFRFFV